MPSSSYSVYWPSAPRYTLSVVGSLTTWLVYCRTGSNGMIAPARTKIGIVARSTARVTVCPPACVALVHQSYQVPVGRYTALDAAPFSKTGAISMSRPHMYCVPSARAAASSG